MWPKLRAGALLFTYISLFVLATPGLESLPSSRQELEETRDDFPGSLFAITEAAMWVEENFRGPLVDVMTPIQRPLRLEQSWALYGSGPHSALRMEIVIDSTLVYRTQDPEHRWLTPQLQHRRIRPMLSSMVTKKNPDNRVGLERFILTQAQAEWPAAEAVELRFTRTPYPDDDTETFRIRRATAPDWTFAAVDLP